MSEGEAAAAVEGCLKSIDTPPATRIEESNLEFLAGVSVGLPLEAIRFHPVLPVRVFAADNPKAVLEAVEGLLKLIGFETLGFVASNL